MKRLAVLSVCFLTALSAFGQTTINVYHGAPPTASYGQPVPMQFAHQYQTGTGNGCVGSKIVGGTGCYGSRMQASGCVGSQGGSIGWAYTAEQPAYYTGALAMEARVYTPPAKMRVVEYEVPVAARPVYGVEVPRVTAPTYGGAYAAPAPRYGVGAAAGAAAYADGLPYGAKVGPGAYATPSGRMAAPAILSEPGAAFPFDGPVRRGFRAAFGYDR